MENYDFANNLSFETVMEAVKKLVVKLEEQAQ
jgi:hypothetical protein